MSFAHASPYLRLSTYLTQDRNQSIFEGLLLRTELYGEFTGANMRYLVILTG